MLNRAAPAGDVGHVRPPVARCAMRCIFRGSLHGPSILFSLGLPLPLSGHELVVGPRKQPCRPKPREVADVALHAEGGGML